jgi:hypothetical protein
MNGLVLSEDELDSRATRVIPDGPTDDEASALVNESTPASGDVDGAGGDDDGPGRLRGDVATKPIGRDVLLPGTTGG